MVEKKLKVKSSAPKSDQLRLNRSQSRVEKIKSIDKKLKGVAVESSKKTKTFKKKDDLTVDVYDLSGKVVDSTELPKEIFGVKVNKRLIAQAVRVYLANQRSGSANTKTRGQVQGSTRKIYKQKGTGRARHGGIRAPIFVHGGIAHGPKTKDYSLKLPQKMKKAALYSMLSAKVIEGDIAVIDGIEKIDGKTKSMVALLNAIKHTETKVLFVIEGRQENVARAIRNIDGVTYEHVNQLHVYEIIRNQKILFTKYALEALVKNIAQKVTKEKK